jgi:hypothetical protein
MNPTKLSDGVIAILGQDPVEQLFSLPFGYVCSGANIGVWLAELIEKKTPQRLR